MRKEDTLTTSSRTLSLLLMLVVASLGPGASVGISQNTSLSSNSSEDINCGLRSLRALAVLRGQVIDSDAWLQVTKRYNRDIITMADILQAGKRLGIELVGMKLSLEELLEQHDLAIVHFTSGHFSLYVDSVKRRVRWKDGGLDMKVSDLEEFRKRFSGYALLPKNPRRSADSQLIFLEPDFDFGDAPAGTPITHVFEYENVGQEGIKITIGSSSCACRTKLLLDSDAIRPGAKGKLEVKIDVPAGPQVHTVLFITTDPVRPVKFVTLHGRGLAKPFWTPSRLLINATRGRSITKRFLLWLPLHLDVRELKSSLSFLSLSTASSEIKVFEREGLRRLPINVSVPEDAPKGSFGGHVVFELNDEQILPISIPVKINIYGRIQVHPEDLFFGCVKRAQKVVKKLQISCHDVKSFSVSEVKCDLEQLNVDKVILKEDGSYAVILSLRSAKTGILRSALKFKTNVVGEEEMQVPIYAEVTE